MEQEDIDMTAHYKSLFSIVRQDLDYKEPLFPGIREMIDALTGREDLLIGAVTGKSRRGLKLVMETHEKAGHSSRAIANGFEVKTKSSLREERFPEGKWCGREDSNFHGLPHSDLNAARLPIPPRPHRGRCRFASAGQHGLFCL